MIVFIKKISGVKAKIKLTFLSFFDNPLSKYFTFKNLSSMYWLFWAIYQRSMGLVFVHMFCILFARYVPYITLYPPVKFQHQIFFISQGINEHEFLITVLSNDDVLNSLKFQDLVLIIVFSNGWQGGKRGRGNYKNLNNSRMKRAF